jgi:hypothetical protein
MSEVGKDEEKINQQLRACLAGIKFPVTKRQLVDFARKNCSPELADMISKSVKDRFNSLAEVEEEAL